MIPSEATILAFIVVLLLPLMGFALYVVRYSRADRAPADWRLGPWLSREVHEVVADRSTRPKPLILKEAQRLAQQSYLRVQRESVLARHPADGHVLIERCPQAIWQHVDKVAARTDATLCLRTSTGEQYVVVHRMWHN